MESNSTNLRYFAGDPAYSTNYAVKIPPPEDRIRLLVREHIPPGTGDCIEIGCSPGGYLTLFGELGYTLHGVDFDPRIATELPAWLAQRGFKPGKFTVADYTTHDFGMLFDVVYSLGFIEHFTNWVDIIGRHAELVQPNGYLVVGAPNYAGIVQRVLHKLFEERNYKTHVTASMNPEVWRVILQHAGFEIIRAGPLGSFDIWTRGDEPLPRITEEFAWMIDDLKPVLARLDDTRGFASAAYLAIVARRREANPPAERLARAEAKTAIDAARRNSETRDRELEKHADAIVGAMRSYFARRAKLSTVLKDIIRRSLGRGG
jgi:SAM-dependent methyltransferase